MARAAFSLALDGATLTGFAAAGPGLSKFELEGGGAVELPIKADAGLREERS